MTARLLNSTHLCVFFTGKKNDPSLINLLHDSNFSAATKGIMVLMNFIEGEVITIDSLKEFCSDSKPEIRKAVKSLVDAGYVFADTEGDKND